MDAATERQTLGSYLPRWLDITAGTVRPRTLERYRQIVRVHLLPALGDQPLASLRPETVQRLYSAELAAGLAPRTVLKSTWSCTVPWRWRCGGGMWCGMWLRRRTPRPCRSTTSSRPV